MIWYDMIWYDMIWYMIYVVSSRIKSDGLSMIYYISLPLQLVFIEWIQGECLLFSLTVPGLQWPAAALFYCYYRCGSSTAELLLHWTLDTKLQFHKWSLISDTKYEAGRGKCSQYSLNIWSPISPHKQRGQHGWVSPHLAHSGWLCGSSGHMSRSGVTL